MNATEESSGRGQPRRDHLGDHASSFPPPTDTLLSFVFTHVLKIHRHPVLEIVVLWMFLFILGEETRKTKK